MGNYFKACTCLERYAKANGKIYQQPNEAMSKEIQGIVYLSINGRTVRYSVKRDQLILTRRQRASEE